MTVPGALSRGLLVLVCCGAVPVSAAPTPGAVASLDKDVLLPVDLKCPSENRGVLEVISKNRRGAVERVRVIYKKGRPEIVLLSTAFFGTYEDDAVIRLNDVTDFEEQKLGAEVASYVDELRSNVCEASNDARQQAYGLLESNRSMLGSDD